MALLDDMLEFGDYLTSQNGNPEPHTILNLKSYQNYNRCSIKA